VAAAAAAAAKQRAAAEAAEAEAAKVEQEQAATKPSPNAAALVAADLLQKAEEALRAAIRRLQKARLEVSAAAQKSGRKTGGRLCRVATAAKVEARAKEEVAALAEARRASRRVRAASTVPPHHSLRHE